MITVPSLEVSKTSSRVKSCTISLVCEIFPSLAVCFCDHVYTSVVLFVQALTSVRMIATNIVVRTQTTLMLWGIWLVSAFMYYGVIMFTTELFIAEDAGVRCPSYLNDSSIPADSGGGDLLTWSATIAPQSSNVTTMNGTKSCVELTESDYRDAFIQSVAELPVCSLQRFRNHSVLCGISTSLVIFGVAIGASGAATISSTAFASSSFCCRL